METLRAWLTLHSVRELSNEALRHLVQTFGSPERVCSASTPELLQRGGVSPPLAESIRQGPDGEVASRIDRDVRSVEQGRLSVLSILDPGYPVRLKTIPDPPPLLYLTGGLEKEDEHALAIVGARKATPGGVAFTEELSENLASLGFTIVSGLARGVDAAAHRGALKGSGRTIAVLGCGIDQTYPPEHEPLRKDIEARGAILSEWPIGTPPRGYHFPRRNRVISGLCLGVVVTEGAMRSGSLITARLAAEQNREVFAVPGSVKNGKHTGPHSLIKQGAKLVEHCHDILEELLPQLAPPFRDRVKGTAPSGPVSHPELESQEQAIFRLLSHEPASMDEIIAQAQVLPAEVMGILVSLELKGLVRQLPGSQYIRTGS